MVGFLHFRGNGWFWIGGLLILDCFLVCALEGVAWKMYERSEARNETAQPEQSPSGQSTAEYSIVDYRVEVYSVYRLKTADCVLTEDYKLLITGKGPQLYVT